jgi:hypothetical protein
VSDPLTPEAQAAIGEMARVYIGVKRFGKWVAYSFAGLLAFIVLLSQAWEAVLKFLHVKVGG